MAASKPSSGAVRLHPGERARSSLRGALLGFRGRHPHPRTRDRSRTVLAVAPLWGLLAGLVVAFLLLALAFGAALALTASGDEPRDLLFWWRQALMALCGLPLKALEDADQSPGRDVVKAVLGLASVIVPALLLGAVVFRLLTAKTLFVLRSRVSLLHQPAPLSREPDPPAGWYLALRLYSATNLVVHDVRFALVLQRDTAASAPRTLTNTTLEVLNPSWPLAETHVPYTLWVALRDGDVDVGDDGEPALVAVQGCPARADVSLILRISGEVPELGTSLVETHRVFVFEQLSLEPWNGVEVLYDGNGPRWKGWRGFDDEPAEPAEPAEASA